MRPSIKICGSWQILAAADGPWKFIPNKRNPPAARGQHYNLSDDLLETRKAGRSR